MRHQIHDLEESIVQLSEDLTNEHAAARVKKKQLEKEIVRFCKFSVG